MPARPGLATTPTAAKTKIVSEETKIESMAILTSYASIFLPKYSGVRPTISPAINTARMTNTSIPYSPEPTPPKIISPSIEHDVQQRNHSPERRERVVHAVDRAAAGVGGHRGEEN